MSDPELTIIPDVALVRCLEANWFDIQGGVGIQFNPSLEIEQWLTIGNILRKQGEGHQFYIGDWCNFGEDSFGEKYSQALKTTDYNYGSLRNLSWVARRISIERRTPLPYSFHKEVARLEPEIQTKYLTKAMKLVEKGHDVTVREFKKMIAEKYPPEARKITYSHTFEEWLERWMVVEGKKDPPTDHEIVLMKAAWNGALEGGQKVEA